MRLHRLGASVCLTLALLSLAASPGRAQSTTAEIQGRVVDASGRPVAGARIQATAPDRGLLRTARTDDEGRFRMGVLEPGVWVLVALSPDGEVGRPVTVQVGLQQTVRVELTTTGGAVEEITVTADRPLLDPGQVSREHRVTGEQAESLPVPGRELSRLAMLDASIQPAPPEAFFGERESVFVVAGQSGRSNSFLVDGLDNNDLTSGTNLSAALSELILRDLVVLTHTFSAEFGRASGGVLNVITERGGNDPVVGAFVQYSSRGMNEPGRFVESLPRDPEVPHTPARTQGGVRLSGPIRRNRAFYLAAVEHRDESEVVPYTGRDRSGVPGGVLDAPARGSTAFFRADWNAGSAHTAMLRVSWEDRRTDGVNVGGLVTPEAGFRLDEDELQLAGSWTTILGPSLLHELRFLAGRSRFHQHAASSRPGVDRPGGIFGGNALNRQLRDEDRVQLVSNLTWQRGDHTLKFGVDVLRSRTIVDARFNPNGAFLYVTDQPFEPGDCGDLVVNQVVRYGTDPIPCPGEEGVDDDGDGVVDEPGLIETYPLVFSLIDGQPRDVLEDTRLAWFVQDQWQATAGLLLDYGLRYDASTFHLPDDARVASFIPNGGAGPDWNNVAPRLGFTWSPGGRGRWVVRGGAGLFYDKLVLAFPAVAAVTSDTRIGLLFPQGLTLEITEDVVEALGIDVIRQGLVFPEEFTLRFSTGTRLDTPYAVHLDLGVERAVGAHGVWRASAVRSRGYHIPLMRDLNPVVEIQRLDPSNPDSPGFPIHRDDTVGSIAAVVTEGRNWHWGLELGYRYQGPSSWWNVAYTLSRTEDMGPDPLKGGIALPPNSDRLDLERARADHDRRHRVVVSGAAGLPWLGLRLAGVLQWSTGLPFNVTTGDDDNLDGFINDRPPGVGRNSGRGTPLAVVNALRAEAGLAPVSRLSEPEFFQVDLRVSRPLLRFRERTHGELYVQVFNLLDRFNPGRMEGRVTAPGFGRPLGLAGPPRRVEFGVRLEVGR